MLERPQPDHNRRRAAARTARWRRRARDGLVPVTIEIDAAVLDGLVRLQWLAERHCDDKAAIARAIAAMLTDAVKFV